VCKLGFPGVTVFFSSRLRPGSALSTNVQTQLLGYLYAKAVNAIRELTRLYNKDKKSEPSIVMGATK